MPIVFHFRIARRASERSRESMLRAPATTFFRAAARCATSSNAPSRAMAMVSLSHNNMMLSTSAFSLDDEIIFTSRDRSASLGATATTNGATTTAAAPPTTMNGISIYFIPPSLNTASDAFKKFIQGGDLTWIMTSSSSSASVLGGIASSLSRMMQGINDRQTDATVVGDLQKDGGTWEDVTSFTTVSQSPSASTTSSTTAALYDESASASGLDSLAIWQISTLKRRKKMMNKHKLQKRRKKLRLKTRK